MGNVEHIFWFAILGWDHLEASWPLRLADAALDRVGCNRGEALLFELFRSGDRQRDIPQLVSPDQRRFDFDLLSHHE